MQMGVDEEKNIVSNGFCILPNIKNYGVSWGEAYY